MAEIRFIGRAVKRLEDRPLLTGAGRFVDDLRFHGMLEAAFVRSPHAHAAIRGIDATAARRLPGVEAPEVWEPADQLPGDALDPRHLHGFAGELRHFVECVRDGRRPDVTVDDGLAAIRIEQAIKRSANERRPVEV